MHLACLQNSKEACVADSESKGRGIRRGDESGGRGQKTEAMVRTWALILHEMGAGTRF